MMLMSTRCRDSGGCRRNASKIIHPKGHGHSSPHRVYYMFILKLMAFKVPHHLRICNVNSQCSVVFTTKHRSSSINSDTSNAVCLHWPVQPPICLITNNMVYTGRLVNLNTLSNNLIVTIYVVNHILFVAY